MPPLRRQDSATPALQRGHGHRRDDEAVIAVQVAALAVPAAPGAP